jgi:hypothetical protein
VQLVSCASGVYLIGTERRFSRNNNLVISRMMDEQGALRCSVLCEISGMWQFIGTRSMCVVP